MLVQEILTVADSSTALAVSKSDYMNVFRVFLSDQPEAPVQ